MKKHLPTVVATLSALIIILLLGIKGMLPPAPEHLEQAIARKQVEAYRCRTCNPSLPLCPPGQGLQESVDDNARNFSCVITSTFTHPNRVLGIETKQLRLRLVERTDIDAIYAYARKPIVAARTVWAAHKSKFETTQIVDGWLKAYEKYRAAPWGIIEKSSGKLIGTAGYSMMTETEPRVVVSYALSDAAWGNGYELEALRALIEFACVHMKCIRVEATARCDDAFSQRIMTQTGMSLEGEEPDYKRVGDQYVSMQRYAILRRDILDQLKDSVLFS